MHEHNHIQPKAVEKSKPVNRAGVAAVLQRKCACGQRTIAGGECDSCRKKDASLNLQRAAINMEELREPPAIVHEVLRSSGQPLDAQTRSFMEPRFSHDFSGVRVHTDARAAESARAINALAYTVGRDVVFGSGRYVPNTQAGQRLLAHELAHVIQQDKAAGALLPKGAGEAASYNALERDADQAAERVIGSQGGGTILGTAGPTQNALPRLKSGLSLQRQPCDKTKDKIITGPLKMELPNIVCDPAGETLDAVRATQGGPSDIMGVTTTIRTGFNIGFQLLGSGMCKAIVNSLSGMNFDPFIYTKAGTYKDGTEVVPEGAPCPKGKTIAKNLEVTPTAAKKIKDGEIEHCEDHKRAFALGEGKYNQAITDLAANEYCPGPATASTDCKKEFWDRFKARTGVDLNGLQTVSSCLHSKSKIRDSSGWHNVTNGPDDVVYDKKNCDSVLYRLNPALSPDIDIKKHPPSALVKGCGEP